MRQATSRLIYSKKGRKAFPTPTFQTFKISTIKIHPPPPGNQSSFLRHCALMPIYQKLIFHRQACKHYHRPLTKHRKREPCKIEREKRKEADTKKSPESTHAFTREKEPKSVIGRAEEEDEEPAYPRRKAPDLKPLEKENHNRQ